MAPQTPICPPCDTAFKALLTALAKFSNIFLIFKSQKYFSVSILTFLRHVIQLTAPCFETYFGICKATVFWSPFSPTVTFQSTSPDSLVLLSPKTWCGSESVLGLFLFLKGNTLLSLCMTLIHPDALMTPQSVSLLQPSLLFYSSCFPHSLSQTWMLFSPHLPHPVNLQETIFVYIS